MAFFAAVTCPRHMEEAEEKREGGRNPEERAKSYI